MKVKRSSRPTPGGPARAVALPIPQVLIVPVIVALCLLGGCHMANITQEVRSSEKVIDGNAERVRVEIGMPAGELRVRPGATKLLSANFRYSEDIGEPVVQYDGTSGSGRLSVSTPRKNVKGNLTNEWSLQLSDSPTYDFHISLGAGTGEVDLSKFTLRGVEVQVGAGKMDLDVSGVQKRDVDVKIQGGVGTASITLPKGMGVEVGVQKGIGGVQIKGLTKNGDRYYNEAYSDGKPVMRVSVQTGIGMVELQVAE